MISAEKANPLALITWSFYQLTVNDYGAFTFCCCLCIGKKNSFWLFDILGRRKKYFISFVNSFGVNKCFPIIHQIVRLSGAPAVMRFFSARRTDTALSSLGSKMASAPIVAAAFSPSNPHGVSMPFTRTINSLFPSRQARRPLLGLGLNRQQQECDFFQVPRDWTTAYIKQSVGALLILRSLVFP